MSKIRIGVIGCGGIANQKHFPAMKNNEDLCEIRQQMLKVTKEELAELAGLFDKTGLDASVCVVGNEEAIAPDDSWEVYRL